MGIVTGTIVTLDQSIIESKAKKYVGYITRCDNSYSYNGTWSPNTSVTGIGVSVLDNILSVWNTNSDTSDVSRDFTWTSSKLSDCIKTFTVVAKGKNCPTYNVILVSKFNDDSDGLLKSVSGNIQLYLYSVVGSGGISSDAVCSNAINKVGEVTSQPSTIPNNCSGVDNVKFIFNNVNLTCSFNGNIANFTVSGGIEYRLGDSGSYTTLSSVNNYTVSTTSNSATIGECSIEDTILWSMMDGSKTLYLKHIITMNYDKDEQCIPVKFSFAKSTYDIKFSGAGKTTNIILNIEDWGDITPDNYNTWGTTGNHLLITSSTGALLIRSKTYNSSGNFSIVVALGGNANITGDIICKDIVCSGEARCTINATYVFGVSLSYNVSDIKTITVSGSLAGSSFGLSLSQKSTSTTAAPGSYNITLTRCDLTANASLGGDTLGLFCNNSSVMENSVLVADIGNISGKSFNISSNFTYSFNVTNYSLAFEIKPYYKPTGKIMFNYTTTGNNSAFRVVVWLESSKGIEDVATVLIYSSENIISNKNIYNFESQYVNGFSNVKVQVVGSANNGNNNVYMNVGSSASATGYTSTKNLSSPNYDYTFDTGLAGYSVSTITISMKAGA